LRPARSQALDFRTQAHETDRHLLGAPPTAYGFGAAGAGVVGAEVVGAGALGAVALGPLGVTAGFIVSGIHRPTMSKATRPARTTSSQGKRDFR
jgi:hypothetical protein